MDALVTQGLTKFYRSSLLRAKLPSLDDLDLTVQAGEVYGFLGKNGAGKTTTIKIVCGLIRPTSGSAHVFGVDVARRAARKRIGYLPENPYFYEYLTPRETIDFYGRLNSLSALERRREWDRLSDLLNLREIGNQRVRLFSKGMRQRLGFAVACVGDPDLLVLDEPMSGLDPLGRRRIRDLILFLRDQGKTLFFSSHVLGDVEQICDRVGILADGRLLVQGRIDELLTRRIKRVEVIATDLPADFAAAMNGEIESTRASEAGTHFLLPDTPSANRLVGRILQAAGTVVEVYPIKESLEDYFLREQEDGERASLRQGSLRGAPRLEAV